MLRANTLVVLLTRNPGHLFDAWAEALGKLHDQPGAVWVIDSSSSDETQSKARHYGFSLSVIDKSDFNHGSTRQFAVESSASYDYIVFMTQDAIFCDPDALEKILSAFSDVTIAAVCGRQLPRRNAKPVEAHARLYNYPARSNLRSIKDAGTLGLKAAFLSNSFSAYRRDALLSVGGFPDDVIFGEDMYVAAKLLTAGYKIAYAADAKVYHSHDYSIVQELKRYFDMGVFHAREPWIRESFGNAENAGTGFVISELNYLLKHAVWRLPEALFRNLMRYAGFRAGLVERHIPLYLKKKISMNPRYFK